MTEPTDTNQASGDESKKPSERKRLFDRLIFMFGWRGETRRNKANKMMKIIDQYTETIIRTEKLKLLAEVRELLIDRIPVYDGDDSFGKEYQAGYNSMAHATRTMQLQQSAELTKLEAEL